MGVRFMQSGAPLNGRWHVLGPLRVGTPRNFTYYEVEDLELTNRVAVLKLARITDLPDEDFLCRRRRMLSAELERLADLRSSALPEPLDYFELDGEPALVSAHVGGERRSYLIRDQLMKAGYRTWESSRYHQVSVVARFLRSVNRFTEEIWREGFVHPNLCPDHLYQLHPFTLRVTGTGAICRRDGGHVDPTEPGQPLPRLPEWATPRGTPRPGGAVRSMRAGSAGTPTASSPWSCCSSTI